jgi:anhydro-N-acetylmuramic acid kinase
MSGTSLDAVDGLLVEFLEPPPQSNHCLSLNPLGFASRELDGALRDQLFALQAPGFDEIARAAQAGNALADLRVLLGSFFRERLLPGAECTESGASAFVPRILF